MNSFETFLQLHQQEQPLLLGNAWDITSAAAFERVGFKAIATSSSAVAQSMGYEDRENIPFELLLEIIKRMSRHIHVPFSVDMEAGYSRDIPGIIANIEKLYDLGVVGFNIEDSMITEPGKLQTVENFQQIISSARDHLERKNMKMFINARTDAFLRKLPSPLLETIKRAKAYEEAGASGIFAPFVDDENDIKQIVQATKLPLNVLVMPSLPSFGKLAEWGVKRISMGGSIYRAVTASLEKTLRSIQTDQSFKTLFTIHH
jgi:2-methylisocitrate lyase-like PEP mutase family enzyme